VTHSTSTSTVIIAVVSSVVFTLAFTVLGVMLYRKCNSRRSEPNAEGTSIPLNSSSQSSSISHEGRQASEPEDRPLTVTETEDGIAVDMPDSLRLVTQQGDRERRNREVEEKALARMRKNAAAMRQLADDAVDGGDVAEGIRRLPERSKDQ